MYISAHPCARGESRIPSPPDPQTGPRKSTYADAELLPCAHCIAAPRGVQAALGWEVHVHRTSSQHALHVPRIVVQRSCWPWPQYVIPVRARTLYSTAQRVALREACKLGSQRCQVLQNCHLCTSPVRYSAALQWPRLNEVSRDVLPFFAVRVGYSRAVAVGGRAVPNRGPPHSACVLQLHALDAMGCCAGKSAVNPAAAAATGDEARAKHPLSKQNNPEGLTVLGTPGKL